MPELKDHVNSLKLLTEAMDRVEMPQEIAAECELVVRATYDLMDANNPFRVRDDIDVTARMVNNFETALTQVQIDQPTREFLQNSLSSMREHLTHTDHLADTASSQQTAQSDDAHANCSTTQALEDAGRSIAKLREAIAHETVPEDIRTTLTETLKVADRDLRRADYVLAPSTAASHLDSAAAQLFEAHRVAATLDPDVRDRLRAAGLDGAQQGVNTARTSITTAHEESHPRGADSMRSNFREAADAALDLYDRAIQAHSQSIREYATQALIQLCSADEAKRPTEVMESLGSTLRITEQIRAHPAAASLTVAPACAAIEQACHSAAQSLKQSYDTAVDQAHHPPNSVVESPGFGQ